MNDLGTRILAAHAKDDLSALVVLYTLTADQAMDEQEKLFFLTHAYVFALETNHPSIAALRDRL